MEIFQFRKLVQVEDPNLHPLLNLPVIGMDCSYTTLQNLSKTLGAQGLSIPGLRLGLFFIGVLWWFQRYLRQRREYKVIYIRFSLMVSNVVYDQAETIFGEQHGCQAMASRYPCKWPFELDVLSAQYKANAEKRLLAFQQPYLDLLGSNMELKILGAVRLYS